MKKAFYMIGIILIIALSLALNFLGGCERKKDGAAEERQSVLTAAKKSLVTVYYATADGQTLLPLSLEVNATTEAARVAVEKLLAGPMTEGATDSVPTDTKLLDLYSIYNTVYVDLSHEFLDIPSAKAQLAVDAVVATVLPLADCQKLQILVEGEGVRAFGPVDLSDPLTMPAINPLTEETPAGAGETPQEGLTRLLFYLPDSASGFIIPHSRDVLLDAALDPPLAQATAILDLWVSQGFLDAASRPVLDFSDNLLTLDFPGALFLTMTQEEEQLFYQALIHSFCPIKGVYGLSLCLDGGAPEKLPQGQPLAQPLTITEPVNRI